MRCKNPYCADNDSAPLDHAFRVTLSGSQLTIQPMSSSPSLAGRSSVNMLFFYIIAQAVFFELEIQGLAVNAQYLAGL